MVLFVNPVEQLDFFFQFCILLIVALQQISEGTGSSSKSRYAYDHDKNTEDLFVYVVSTDVAVTDCRKGRDYEVERGQIQLVRSQTLHVVVRYPRRVVLSLSHLAEEHPQARKNMAHHHRKIMKK